MLMPVRMFMFMGMLFPVLLARQFFFAVDVDIDLGRCNSAAIHGRNLQPCSNIQRRDSLLEEMRWHSGVHERTHEHVATHAGKTVEIRDAHRNRL